MNEYKDSLAEDAGFPAVDSRSSSLKYRVEARSRRGPMRLDVPAPQAVDASVREARTPTRS